MHMEVRYNRNRNFVLMFARGIKVTQYLGIESTQLTALQMPNDEFDREFFHVDQRDPHEYALTWTRNHEARTMIPISGSALRVLLGIIKGQTEIGTVNPLTTNLESMMTEENVGFRKPDGPVAKVHAFLDKKLDLIKAGTVSRKQLIDEMVEKKGLSLGTVTTQCGKWATLNNVSFVRPTQADAIKAEAKEKAKAAKKAPAKAAKAPAAKKVAPKANITAAAAAQGMPA